MTTATEKAPALAVLNIRKVDPHVYAYWAHLRSVQRGSAPGGGATYEELAARLVKLYEEATIAAEGSPLVKRLLAAAGLREDVADRERRAAHRAFGRALP